MIEKINELYGTQAASKVGRKKPYGSDGDGVTQKEDAVNVSSFAKEMATVFAEMKKIPEVREDKSEDLRKQIAQGTYNPDMNLLAQRLVWAGILNSEE